MKYWLTFWNTTLAQKNKQGMTHKNYLATQKPENLSYLLFEASDDEEDKEESSSVKVNSTSDAEEEEEAEVDMSDDNSGLISCYQTSLLPQTLKFISASLVPV